MKLLYICTMIPKYTSIYRSTPSMQGQTVRDGRLINTAPDCCREKTGIQKMIDLKNGIKRAEKVSIMTEAMSISKMMSSF